MGKRSRQSSRGELAGDAFADQELLECLREVNSRNGAASDMDPEGYRGTARRLPALDRASAPRRARGARRGFRCRRSGFGAGALDPLDDFIDFGDDAELLDADSFLGLDDDVSSEAAAATASAGAGVRSEGATEAWGISVEERWKTRLHMRLWRGSWGRSRYLVKGLEHMDLAGLPPEFDEREWPSTSRCRGMETPHGVRNRSQTSSSPSTLHPGDATGGQKPAWQVLATEHAPANNQKSLLAADRDVAGLEVRTKSQSGDATSDRTAVSKPPHVDADDAAEESGMGEDSVSLTARPEPAASKAGAERELGSNARLPGALGQSEVKGRTSKTQSPRVCGRKSPHFPRFAFEWFCDENKNGSKNEGGDEHLAELVQKWKALDEAERAKYVARAHQDRHRFDVEYERYRLQQVSEKGILASPVTDIIAKRQSALERKLASLDRKASQRKAAARPPGYPKACRSAYCFFFKDHMRRAREQQASEVISTSQDAALCDASVTAPVSKSNNAAAFASAAKAWKELPVSERLRFEAQAAEDKNRFQQELETWAEKDPSACFGGGYDPKKVRSSKPRLPKPQLPPLVPTREMDQVLQGAFLLGLDAQREEQKRKAKKDAAADVARASQGTALSDWFDAGARAGQAPSQGGSLPEPLGTPSEMKPDTTVDDLLGDLLAVETQRTQDDYGADEFDEDHDEEDTYAQSGGGALLPLLPHDDFDRHSRRSGGGWSEMPEAAGAPQVLGPQLCFDECGNIVLKQSSLSTSLDEDRPRTTQGPIQECSVSEYEQAYRRTPPTKWSDAETDDFYEALKLYGTDLFLVQTFFRNKSAAQVKSKYSKELKKHPERVHMALTSQSQKLTKDTFERLHGKIDTSKHFKPPPSPLPGEEQEADASVPGSGRRGGPEPEPEPAPPPPEPEYSAEDESLTTNRLMALFD